MLPDQPAAPALTAAAPQNGADGKRPEPDEQRKALVKQWGARIDKALKDNEKLFKEFEKRRKRLRGIKSGSSEAVSNEERTNLVYSTLAAILPAVYAKNPDISISPAEAAAGSRYGVIKAFTSTLEAVIERLFVQDAFLKKRAKACTRSAMTTSVGWAKVMYQRDIRTDPIIQNRMNDVQDNLERMKATIAAIEDPQQLSTEEANKASLEQQLAALSSQVEKTISEGLVIDNCLSEDILILDATVRSFDGYRQAGALAQRVWFTKEKFETAFGYKPEKATPYQTTSADQNSAQPATDSKVALYAVFEIWDKDTDTVYTYCRGEENFCREPYQPEKLGTHWYPFFPLGFNLVDGQFYPMSDVEMLEQLSDEYNDTNLQLKDIRDDSIPVRVVRSGGALTPEDVDKIQKRKSREVVVISGAGGKPLKEDMEEFAGVTVNALLYDTTRIRGDLDMVSGSTDASRGSVVKAKTATEAEYLQAGLAGRTGERQDAIADWIEDMAQYAAEILVQELTPEQVKRIAGETAQWPTMAKDDALDMARIEVRAGSMGKPNKSQEQEQWAKVLPLIQDGMKQVTELRSQGMDQMADAAVELLRETLRRFDERIDIDRFIPPAPEKGQVDPQQLQAKLQAMQAQLTELQKAADTNKSAQTVALIEGASNIIVEREKRLMQTQEDAAAVSREILQEAATLQTAAPADGASAPAPVVAPANPQTAQVH